jgi:hypothetical protein
MAGDRDVEFVFAQTERPWELEIDGIVLSVGRDLGSLGHAVRDAFPNADWASVDLEAIAAGRVTSLLLDPERSAPSRRAILVTARGQGGEAPTVDSIITATVAALEEAGRLGVTAIGLPLLGTGVLGADKGMVAYGMVTAADQTVPRFRSLRRVVFFGRSASDGAAVRAEFAKHGIGEDSGDQPAPEVGELAGGISRDLVDPNRAIPLASDRLGFAPYVSMLATVIADRETPLPLSIGVFGEWGAGKSTFMGMLRSEVGRLADGERYCGEIAQIGFNAWHYADSNLWASLGDEIFRQLAGAETTSRERAGQLRAELADRLEQRKQLEAVTQQAREKAAELRERADEALAAREGSARELVRTLGNSVWRQLSVTEEAEQARLLAEELRGTLTEAELLRRTPWDRRGRIAYAAAAILLLGGLFAAAMAPALREWLSGVGGAFVLVAGWGTWALARARKGLRQLRKLGEDLHAGMVREAVGDELAKLRAAEADQLVAEAQLREVVQHVGELGRELAELAPGSRLYSFLADRAQSEAYRGNLGLISTIRKDFEQLVRLMVDWRTNPDQGDSPRQPVDRIVLYIDDLDRCGPSQVVDVLQAVHLLLAFELFVVVVGVDPRWLLRSVRSHYGEVLGDHATPEDYLEKIVNIPFALPGMVDGSMSRLLRGLVGPSTDDIPARLAGMSEPVAEEPGLITVEPGSEVDDQRRPAGNVRPPRPMTEPELTLLAALDPLIGTPREAKRIFNLYRMVRATRNLSDASTFLDGDYQAVIVLLGLLTAPADLARPVLDALLARPGDTTWSAFLADVLPQPGNRHALVGSLPDGDVRRWRHLHDALTKVSAQTTLTDLSLLQTWLPRIRRFTYTLPTPRAPLSVTPKA